MQNKNLKLERDIQENINLRCVHCGESLPKRQFISQYEGHYCPGTIYTSFDDITKEPVMKFGY